MSRIIQSDPTVEVDHGTGDPDHLASGYDWFGVEISKKLQAVGDECEAKGKCLTSGFVRRSSLRANLQGHASRRQKLTPDLPASPALKSFSVFREQLHTVLSVIRGKYRYDNQYLCS